MTTNLLVEFLSCWENLEHALSESSPSVVSDDERREGRLREESVEHILSAKAVKRDEESFFYLIINLEIPYIMAFWLLTYKPASKYYIYSLNSVGQNHELIKARILHFHFWESLRKRRK